MALRAQEFESTVSTSPQRDLRIVPAIGVRLTCLECPESVYSKKAGLIIGDERLGLTDPSTLQALTRVHIRKIRGHGPSTEIEATTHILPSSRSLAL